MEPKNNLNLRYAILNTLILLMGIAMIFKLLDLQIVKGEEYREISQSRLFRESYIQAPRGEIFDRNGLSLATNREAFNIQMVKTPIKEEELNRTILALIEVLEKNGDSFKDSFPLTAEPVKLEFRHDSESDKLKIDRFKKLYGVKEADIADRELFDHIKNYYDIPDEYTAEQTRKVAAVRHEMKIQPRSQFDPVEIAVDVSRETVAELEERHLEFPGVSIAVQPVRHYPNGKLASHIIGYIGKINERELKERKDKGYKLNDVIGKDGVEYVFEELLRGKNGLKRVEMDTMGRLTGEIGAIEPEPGNNIYLTIDLKLQEVAEKALEDTINSINSGGFKDKFEDAKSGSVVAIDIKTGEVLALANYPSYDPSLFVRGISLENWNKLREDEQNPMFNRAIAGLYSPGSTFKMVPAVTALQERKVGLKERIRDEGVYKRYNDYQPKCWIWGRGHRTHGHVDVTEAIKVSCNYFFYEMGYRSGVENLNRYARMFGLGRRTGVELPGEKEGILAGPAYRETIGKRWYPGDTLAAAIGQSDYSFTPIQMANYIASLTNGTVRNRPHLVIDSSTWQGQPIDKEKILELLKSKLGIQGDKPPEALKLDKENLSAVLEGMRSVTGDAGGTAYGTFVNFPVSVGGKTGTVQVPGRHKNGKAKSDNAWFVGFAPFDNPEIAVAVIIEHGGHGSYTAPVARDIFAQYFGLYQHEEEEDAGEESGNTGDAVPGGNTQSPQEPQNDEVGQTEADNIDEQTEPDDSEGREDTGGPETGQYEEEPDGQEETMPEREEITPEQEQESQPPSQDESGMPDGI